MGLADPLPQRQWFVAGLAASYLSCLTFTTISLAGCAEDNTGIEILFADDATHLSAADKRAIAALIEATFPLSTDGLRFEHPDCGDVVPVTDVVDLNSDDDYEVFVSWGNACTSGMTGRSLSLFIADASGDYHQSLGFPALGWTVLESREESWPDLSFGGPGFCHAVWTWHENGYEFKCNLAETEGGCNSRGDVC